MVTGSMTGVGGLRGLGRFAVSAGLAGIFIVFLPLAVRAYRRAG